MSKKSGTRGNMIPLVASIAPLLACFEMLVQVHSNAPQQPPKTVVGEDTPESDAGVPWYITICPAIFPVMPLLRRVKVLAILLGVAGASVCLVLLFQWYSSNRATVRQISPLVRRITDYRLNLLRFAFWNASSDVGYGTTSPEPFSSQSWFRRTHKVPPGYRRISWECSCGELLAADFENSNPDATTALQQRLHGLSNTGIANSPQQNSGNLGSATGSTSQGNSQSSTPQPQTPTGSRKRPSANTSGTSTPSTSHQGASNSNISQRARKPRYLELCVSVGQHSVNLGEINISSVTTDGQLFKKIWESYREIKKSSSESTLRNWFFKPDDVFFVHFGVTNRHQVGIYGKPMEIPPPEEVQQGRYHYFQCPMQPLPPMPNHIFLHYLDRAKSTSSSNTHAEDIYLSRLPKKTGSSIFTARTGVNTTVLYGWGVHIIERPSAFAQSMVGIASALICIVFFGFTWGFADLSTAIGIGQFVGAVLALANAAIYFALQAYSTRLSRKAE
ncbi:hypothetical protein B0T16DRAFT_224837 [Cercophora newfieldiana]|uniref:Transmembrane protein n=1 Tax=Cercophora newfieldiana TaxID=92897 RepID=A0AA39XXU2_9PEZI|nr:hypothetical protein B0T16DRAFT_224837 [Cercophora newfieldiana]